MRSCVGYLPGMTDRIPVTTEDAPAAIGPYSQAVRHGNFLFCSGQIPLDPESGDMVQGSLADETSRCLENLASVCRAAGTSLRRAVRLTIYTTHLESFAEINEAYGAYFPDEGPPARAAIGVAALPKGANVEIDAIVAMS
jgi:2-iminobutanoate/2-iminopropanoate deaminase